MKNLKLKLFSVITALVMLFTVTGCLDEGTVLEFVNLPNSVYVYNQSGLPLNDIKIKVNDQEVVLQKAVDDKLVVVAGNVWTDPGNEEVDYTLIIQFEDMTISFPYKVINQKPNESAKEELDVEWAGTGTQQDPYQLFTENELFGFAAVVNGKKAKAGVTDITFKDKYVQLKSDVTLTKGWEPIGEGFRKEPKATANYFAGTFDGGNHTISNMSNVGYNPAFAAASYENSSKKTIENGYVYGLFGLVHGGTVKNVRLANVNIEPVTVTIKDNVVTSYMVDSGAGIVAYTPDSNRNAGFTNDVMTSVVGCEVASGTIKVYDAGAGILGRAYTPVTIESCVNRAYVESTREKGGKAAGIISIISNEAVNSVLTNCSNYGEVRLSTGTLVGGIASHIARATTFENCSNYGRVYGKLTGEATAKWVNNAIQINESCVGEVVIKNVITIEGSTAVLDLRK